MRVVINGECYVSQAQADGRAAAYRSGVAGLRDVLTEILEETSADGAAKYDGLDVERIRYLALNGAVGHEVADLIAPLFLEGRSSTQRTSEASRSV